MPRGRRVGKRGREGGRERERERVGEGEGGGRERHTHTSTHAHTYTHTHLARQPGTLQVQAWRAGSVGILLRGGVEHVRLRHPCDQQTRTIKQHALTYAQNAHTRSRTRLHTSARAHAHTHTHSPLPPPPRPGRISGACAFSSSFLTSVLCASVAFNQ
jgi:hypothetical protein